LFFFSSRRRHTRCYRDWSSDVCSSDLLLEAWRAGAPLVKLFPAAAVGPGFMRDVLAPLPFLRLVPSGGVTLENAGEWIRAGAARSEARRVGKGWRYRGPSHHIK